MAGSLIDTTPENRNDWSRRVIEWSPDGSLLASSTTHDDRIWDVESGQLIFQHGATYERQGDISVAWCSDGERLAVSGDGIIRIVDVETQEITLEFEDPVYGHLLNSIHCYGTRLAVVGTSGAFIDLSTGNTVDEFIGRNMAWHPEGNLIATSRGGPVIILDVDNLAVVTTIDTGLSAINELAWDPDGTRLAVATEAGEIVHIWGE